MSHPRIRRSAVLGILLLVIATVSLAWVPQRNSRFPSPSVIPAQTDTLQAGF